MKLRPLPPIDTANFAVLPPKYRIRALRRFNQGWAPFSYKPFRRSLSDLLSIGGELLTELPKPNAAEIRKTVVRLSSSEKEEMANLGVTEALLRFRNEVTIRARFQLFFDQPIGVGHSLRFWENAVFNVNGTGTILCVDPRRKGLSREGLRFLFSTTHQRTRALDTDYGELRLGRLAFGERADGGRTATIEYFDDDELFSAEEIDNLLSDLYADWAFVCEERQAEARRSTSSFAEWFGGEAA